jgi:hypothetical protein
MIIRARKNAIRISIPLKRVSRIFFIKPNLLLSLRGEREEERRKERGVMSKQFVYVHAPLT